MTIPDELLQIATEAMRVRLLEYSRYEGMGHSSIDFRTAVELGAEAAVVAALAALPDCEEALEALRQRMDIWDGHDVLNALAEELGAKS